MSNPLIFKEYFSIQFLHVELYRKIIMRAQAVYLPFFFLGSVRVLGVAFRVAWWLCFAIKVVFRVLRFLCARFCRFRWFSVMPWFSCVCSLCCCCRFFYRFILFCILPLFFGFGFLFPFAWPLVLVFPPGFPLPRSWWLDSAWSVSVCRWPCPEASQFFAVASCDSVSVALR